MFPDFPKRIKDLQIVMSKSDMNAIVLTGYGSLMYFGGVLCPWRSALIVTKTGLPSLVTCRYDKERVQPLTWIKDIHGWSFDDPSDFSIKIISVLREHDIIKGNIGAELDIAHTPGVLSAKEMLDLKEALPKIKINNALKIVQELMLIKDDYEVEQLRRAAEVADVAMQTGFSVLRAGVSELSILGAIENSMRCAGSIFTWSVTGNEIGSGYRQRYAEGFTVMASNKIVQVGDLVTFDVHPMVSGYLGDLALNAVVGNPSAKVRQLADGWEEVVQKLVNGLKPGKTVHDVACIAEEAVKKQKLEAFCIPTFGHGLGTDARIPPVIRRGDERVLQPRMVVEALLQITDPNVGGMRLEVPVLLTEKGNEILCKTPLKLHVCQ